MLELIQHRYLPLLIRQLANNIDRSSLYVNGKYMTVVSTLYEVFCKVCKAHTVSQVDT